MATTTVPATGKDDLGLPDEGGPDVGDPDGRAFFRWAVGAQVAVTAAFVVAILVRVGHLTYTLDDAAIHLSVADHLAHDGTWGVAAGRFESASSSPLWTLLLAAGTLVAGPAVEWLPLLLNVAAGIAVLWLLAQGQRAVRPGPRRPLDVAATVLLVVAALFLPGLAVVGMEHALHTALVLAAVLGVHRWVLDETGPGPVVVCALVALATLTRFETAFVALGLAVALVASDRGRWAVRAVALLASAAVPIVGFGIVNRALGGGWLPNSLLAKGNGPGEMQRDSTTPVGIVERAASDPLLLVLVAGALVYVVVRGRSGTTFVPAVVLLTAATAHVVLADVGWYERYQAYLLAIGVYAALVLLAELPDAVARRGLVALCVLVLVAGVGKVQHTIVAPLAADDMYRHQYQAGRFLERYYDGVPVATDQLGYISLFHDGSLTDFAGLGDYEALQRFPHQSARDFRAGLVTERGVEVVVVYDLSPLSIPSEWIRVGEWRLSNEPVTGVTRDLAFYAVSHEQVGPLHEALTEYEPELPARTELILDERAGLRAMAAAAREAEERGA